MITNLEKRTEVVDKILREEGKEKKGSAQYSDPRQSVMETNMIYQLFEDFAMPCPNNCRAKLEMKMINSHGNNYYSCL